MRQAFKYRLFPTKKQTEFLDTQLAEAQGLYNAALQERRDAYNISHVSINYYNQANQLKEIRADGDCGLENFSCCQDVLRRVDKTFKAFFRRCKEGKGKAGFPRFKSRDRYNSITFPSYGDGCRLLHNGKLRVQGLGQIKVKLHRAVEGTIKTVPLLREAGKYYVCFSCEVEPEPLPVLPNSVGIDVGLTTFAVLSDGTEVENPRHFRKSEEKLAHAQQVLARKKRGSNSRKKANKTVQKVHAKIRNQRNDFQHKVSRFLVNNYGAIFVENLNIKGLASGILAKSVNDAAWGGFLNKTSYKALNAGRVYGEVYAPGTSQVCLCGAEVPKTLSDRWHHCESCGLSEPRDHVSSKVIKSRGLREYRKHLPSEAALL
ncbi:MAG: transposase [Blastocatellales bacterium]|nr:transposase [Blastocatellales bacterium]MCW5971403.1 transposase [Blastocatellales bacterium]MCW5971646.1 transposase [Blastocatellales bacterium]